LKDHLEAYSSYERQKSLIEECFQTYFEGLHRYAFTILKDNDDAKDAVQAVFMKLWEYRDQIDESKSLKAFLYRAVYNYCLNVKRHHQIVLRYQAEQRAGVSGEENMLISKENTRRIMDQIAALAPQCRLIFTKSRFENKTYAEIAAELGLSVKTVEVQMGKALKILRAKLFGVLVLWTILFLM